MGFADCPTLARAGCPILVAASSRQGGVSRAARPLSSTPSKLCHSEHHPPKCLKLKTGNFHTVPRGTHEKTRLILAIIVGITLLLWAGVHNHRERTLALQRAQENRIVLAPVVPGQKGTESAESQSDAPPQLRGKAAPAFTLVTLEGKKVSLADFKGRPVLVNFWATWCAPCKLEMPWFEEYRAKYAAQGLQILGIAEDDAGKDEIAKAAKKLGVTYPILLTDGKVAPAYGGVDYLPMSFYVDAKGIVVEETAGLASKDEVEANIRKILATPSAATAGGQ